MRLDLVGLTFCFSILHYTQGDIKIFGDPLDRNSKVLIRGARRVWLLTHLHLEDGVITRFKAYFHNDNPVRFQVWRAVDPVRFPGKYFLVHSVRTYAVHPPGIKEIHLSHFNVLHVKRGDMLGLLHENEAATIGYQAGSIDYLYGNFPGDNYPEQYRGIMDFYTGVWPFKHSVEFVLDTDAHNYGPPRNTVVPPVFSTTIRPNATGRPKNHSSTTTDEIPLGVGPGTFAPGGNPNEVEEIEPVPAPPRTTPAGPSDSDDSNHMVNGGMLVIIGGALGGFLVLDVIIVVIVALYCVMKRRKSETRQEYVPGGYDFKLPPKV